MKKQSRSKKLSPVDTKRKIAMIKQVYSDFHRDLDELIKRRDLLMESITGRLDQEEINKIVSKIKEL